jgi:hypothetical protein
LVVLPQVALGCKNNKIVVYGRETVIAFLLGKDGTTKCGENENE